MTHLHLQSVVVLLALGTAAIIFGLVYWGGNRWGRPWRGSSENGRKK